jgi:hypothetical protein
MASAVQIGRPFGSMIAWMFAPKSRCFPEYQAPMLSPLTLRTVSVTRSQSKSLPSRMTNAHPLGSGAL